ncbi:hypothetical protein IEQ34_001284 [Dendrobium chrysotoxum]|uniref:RING-type domain-containing protein n=1 Tax=Dendrobium chrysotoxum TaxID=161865 RepID=A0AAV7HKU9_DENCH|nr:hypothetical protein IEQ34_001284 [Dendrobium chrysotoxum]
MGMEHSRLKEASKIVSRKFSGKFNQLILSIENYEQFIDALACPICLTNQKDMTFGCGHLTCKGCGETLERCPRISSSDNRSCEALRFMIE